MLADLAYQGAVAGADAKLVMQEALGASVFVHTVLPGLAAITGEKAQAMVAATGEIVAAINGLQATLQGLTVSATVKGRRQRCGMRCRSRRPTWIISSP